MARQFSPRLNQIEFRLAQIAKDLQALPVISDIDALGTHGFHSNFSPQSEEHWFEIRWDQPQDMDGIGLIPTRITTQSGRRSNYGLPVRMRIEATRGDSNQRLTLAGIADTRLDQRRGEPIFLKVNGSGITSLRFIPIEPAVLQALAAGAGGYFLKADRLDTILRGIREALAGGAPLNSHIAHMILSTFNNVRPEKVEVDLTERERETLSLLAKGLIKKEIADRLGDSYHTVDTNVRNIYAKLKVHNLSGAVAKAIQMGLT